MSTISSREFDEDSSEARRAATVEPVIITDGGSPSHVLMSIQEYRRLVGDRRSILDWLSVDDDIDLVVAPMRLAFDVQS